MISPTTQMLTCAAFDCKAYPTCRPVMQEGDWRTELPVAMTLAQCTSMLMNMHHASLQDAVCLDTPPEA